MSSECSEIWVVFVPTRSGSDCLRPVPWLGLVAGPVKEGVAVVSGAQPPGNPVHVYGP
jgi:hypothetical protein